MKLLLFFLLTSVFSVTVYATDESEFSKDVFRAVAMEEMHRFVDSLNFDELINILGLAKGICILPYSMLSMKLQLFLILLEKRAPGFENFDDENDTEMGYFFYQLHATAYERAWTLLEVMPCADYYHSILIEQMDPKEYAQLLEEQRATVAQLLVD